jgi:SAM-dependent methyltransferase
MMSNLSIVPPSVEDAAPMRAFLAESKYSMESVLQTLGMARLPSPRNPNVAVLLDLTAEPTAANVLFRLFFLGVSQDRGALRELIPEWFIDLACGCKLLRNQGKLLVPLAMLFPWPEQWVACDVRERFEAAIPDFVLWPNPTSQLLSRVTVRRPSRATLDLGTGTGVLSVAAAKHSERVVGTDLNPRALDFARFNARLNGAENTQFVLGDGFEPVKDQKFDLIVSNPPFFLTPSSHFLFCDNPMELDQMCRKIVKEATAHLNEDGYLQMLCEWAEVEGQPWQERITEWFMGTGCDAWVLKNHSRKPHQYATDRIGESTVSTANDAARYREYMEYYRQRKVRAVHDGIIFVRRRCGTNWLLLDEYEGSPDSAIGDLVAARFAAHDFLEAKATPAQLLEMKPRLSPFARLDQTFEPGTDGWQASSLTLRLARGFPVKVGVQPLVAEFLAGCNGQRTVAEMVQGIVQTVGAPTEQVQTECLAILRKMVAQGFVIGA